MNQILIDLKQSSAYKKLLKDFDMKVENTKLDDTRGNLQLAQLEDGAHRKNYKIMKSGKVYFTNPKGYTTAIYDNDPLNCVTDYEYALSAVAKHASKKLEKA